MATLRAMAEAGAIALTAERSGPGTRSTAAGGVAPGPDTAPALTAPQAAVVAEVERLMDAGGGAPPGARGDRLGEDRGLPAGHRGGARPGARGSLVLVPEIALTPQLLRRLRARLGESIAIWHSALTPAQRAAEHRRVREGRADVVLGARSAVFAPVTDLGLIVVDEEHDGVLQAGLLAALRRAPGGRPPGARRPAPSWSTGARRRAPRPGAPCRA